MKHKCPLLHQFFPGSPEALERARAWAMATISERCPRVSLADAIQVIATLLATAIQHTPESDLVEIHLLPIQDGGVVIRVKNPNSPACPHTGAWPEISRLARNFGASVSPDGTHTAWCELPEAETSP